MSLQQSPTAQELLAQLDDIRGLAPVAALPLAPGWWLLLGLAACLLAVAAIVLQRRRAYARSWKGDAQRALDALAAGLTEADAREAAGALSGTLRRIAMKRYSRSACAGLAGKNWLRFLGEKDPRGFDWTGRGAVLVEAPYAPPGKPLRPDDLKPLIEAAKEWVR
jgi:hypothetical protein